MTFLRYIIGSILLLILVVGVVWLLARNRRKAMEKARAEKLRETNQPLNVWLCRSCGFMTLMRNQECTWCGAPRPDDFMYRTIRQKDFVSQVKKPPPKPYTDGLKEPI
jgi:hypothetical protein